MNGWPVRFQQSIRDNLRRSGGAIAAIALSIGLTPTLFTSVAQAQTAGYCFLSNESISQKDTARQAAMQGDRDAQNRYRALVREHSSEMLRCRSQTWPQTQAIWVRLYPCDANPGVLETVLDDIVNRGYNQVYVEVFYNGQVLLPQATNHSPWPSVIRTSGYETKDLLAEAIAKGRERGLSVYAWMFTLNFGYSYAQRPDADQALARNGQGHTSLSASPSSSEELFVDPYSPQAKRDYYALVQSVTQRRPDGVLFDYIRYPRGEGAASVAGHVRDLWIYSPAAQQALFQRALNQGGQSLIYQFLSRGYVTADDVRAAAAWYPQEGEPLWQGRTPLVSIANPPEQVQPYLQAELWQLAVAHAIQGVLDFLALAIQPVTQQGLRAGAVFFPEANQSVGTGGYDSRLQAWDRFPSTIEWHPMAYAACGNTGCIVSQVQRVFSMAASGTAIQPALAGAWGQTINNHPPLEAQMQSLHRAVPQLNAVSHFAYSWQTPQFDRDRKFCQLQ